MTRSDRGRDAKRLMPAQMPAGIVVSLSALIAAAPSIHGEFLGGDDKHLLLNHVLVNHPSWENALKLLTLDAQRDLYQPVPLLLFAAEFALVRLFDIPLTSEGSGAGARVFHLTNILLHAANTWLVFVLFRRLYESPTPAVTRAAPKTPWSFMTIPFFAALLFGVHPMAVESYAWLNGRMTLLAAFFSLIALVFMDRCLTEWRRAWGVLAVLAVVLAMCSKVRVELPVLMLILPAWRRLRPTVRWWTLYGLISVLTLGFVILNGWTTHEEGLFEGGASLQGSKLARCVITVGWYLWTYVWPTGLSPHYPTDTIVTWSHPMVAPALGRIATAITLILISLRWTRLGLLAAVWFLASIASTLPIVPARNLLAADRYAYLANIGFHWLIASFAVYLWSKTRRKTVIRIIVGFGGFVCIMGLTWLSWLGAGYFRDDLSRARRIAALHPETIGCWERLAWALYDRGYYQEAIDAALIDLDRHPEALSSRVYQVVGMAQDRLGRREEGIATLRKAVEAAPENPKAHTRLGSLLAEAGREKEAALHYRRAMEADPSYNPAILHLAHYLRENGEIDEAIPAYQQVLRNNAYDVSSIQALAEIDMSRGEYAGARRRLEELLSWMPQNVVARTNLGVCYAQMGFSNLAMDQYRLSLLNEPGSPTASANLAQLLNSGGNTREAFAILSESLRLYPTDLTVLIAHHDIALTTGQSSLALAAWREACDLKPDSSIFVGWLALCAAQSEEWAEVDRAVSRLQTLGVDSNVPDPVTQSQNGISQLPGPAHLARALASLHRGDPGSSIALVDELPNPRPDLPDAAQRWKQALISYGAAHSEEPWPYLVIATVLQREGDPNAAAALQMFDELCTSNECVDRSAELRRRLIP